MTGVVMKKKSVEYCEEKPSSKPSTAGWGLIVRNGAEEYYRLTTVQHFSPRGNDRWSISRLEREKKEIKKGAIQSIRDP